AFLGSCFGRALSALATCSWIRRWRRGTCAEAIHNSLNSKWMYPNPTGLKLGRFRLGKRMESRSLGHIAARDGLCNLGTEWERTAARRRGQGIPEGAKGDTEF